MPAKAKTTAKPKGERKKRTVTPQVGKRKKQIQGRLTKDEREFCKQIALGLSVAEVERKLGIADTYGYIILKRPRVAAFLEKLQVKVEEKQLEKCSDEIVDMLSVADTRLMEILKSAPGEFYGYKDVLKAIELAYKRRGGLPNNGKPPDTPGQAAAAAIAQAQMNVNLTIGGGTQGGESIYEPEWIRNQYGINCPDADRIDREFGGIASLPSGPIAQSAADVEDALEAGDETAVDGAQFES